MYKALIGILGVSTVGLLAATIVLATNKGNSSNEASEASASATVSGVEFLDSKIASSFFASEDDNVCAGAKLAFENKLCADLEVVPPQAGANVTKGYVGNLDVNGTEPNIKPYWQSNMCPVNVHWHLGSEHYSYGEFDEYGNGPHGNIPRPEWADRDLASTGTGDPEGEHQVPDGFRCRHYDATDAKFTTPYNWQHCKGMEVGETYEVPGLTPPPVPAAPSTSTRLPSTTACSATSPSKPSWDSPHRTSRAPLGCTDRYSPSSTTNPTSTLT
jgi:hypothetical protein